MSARFLLPFAGVAVLAACTAGEDAARADAAAFEPNRVSVTATEYDLQAPDSIPEGWTTFHLANRGAEIHYGHILRLEPGRTVEELAHFYREAIREQGGVVASEGIRHVLVGGVPVVRGGEMVPSATPGRPIRAAVP
jgi:hypothetical protein